MAEPTLSGDAITNVAEEHIYKVRVEFGAGTVSTIYANECVVTRPTATTLVVTLPTTYTRVSSGGQLWAKATGAASLAAQITTDAVATTGVLTFTMVASNTAGTATAPASGDVLLLSIGVSRNILNDKTQTTA